MKKAIVISFLALTSILIQQPTFAQSKGKAPVKPVKPVAPTVIANVDPVLMNIGNDAILKSEFERVYRKNNKDSVYTESAIREYLDLYINYKLKVKEAEELKLDTSETFTTELLGYRKQLAQPYLTDKNVSEQLVREAYDRLSKDVRASHVLLKISQEALPKDTLAVYNRIMKIRDQILKTGDFAKVARDSSEDPSAKDNGGDLGYFTGMQMVYPFESVAYSTKPGQISMPVRTRFGYHIIKTVDIRPAQGEIHVAHIMVRAPKEPNDSISKAAEVKIAAALAELKAGGIWDSLVVKYSEDKASSKKGGELPFFGTGRMVPEFEKAAFALKKDGDISDVIKTSYGWHIIKRIEKRVVPTFDEKKGELKQMISRDSRNESSKISMVNKIKAEYKFKEVPKSKEELINSLDSALIEGNWDLTKADKFTKNIFSLTDDKGIVTNYGQQDFAKYISTHQTKRTNSTAQAIGYSMFDQWVIDQCLAYEENRLDQKYPDFKNLMKEYRDGILLFDLTDKMVWSKAVKDSAGLAEFYDKNKNNYLWGERCDATIYTLANEKVAEDFRKMVKKGKLSTDEIITEINKKTPNAISRRDGRFNHGENETIELSGWKQGMGNNLTLNNAIYIVDIKSILAPTPKTLEETKGVITADYQTYLEKEWIASLRAKYPVSVNNEVLQTVWKR